ncbi:hypothetical protein [Nocardioides marmoribigeumensis]|uniref:Alpha-glucosidase (Family GH31 glycosyl hydrolase) n=1 Tax=Nocardioides marmoribigeumensis TaxID=433649 RepID=A0ABU2BSB1_9ACTN|nr:hypothetical protein [Nocardioides marmoribigeumensis]MDR7361515.1 alpha-glucosidase (family GH31 glycosyl hydrolase) [Nocardioides marmoribigeumensis]
MLRFRDRSATRRVRPTPGARHVPLNPGILTREGWYVLADTATALLVDQGAGFRVRPPHDGAYRDWYAFGDGHDLQRALGDLRALTGRAPLLPRHAFGVWFSKYFAFIVPSRSGATVRVR